MSRRDRWTPLLARLATLLLIASVAFGLFLVAEAAVGFGPNGEEVGVHTQVDADRIADLPTGAIPPDDVEIIVRVHDASDEQHRWAAARDLAPGLVVVAALWLLRGLLRSARDEDPFTPRNVQRLRIRAGVVLIGTPVAGLVSSFFAGELADSAGLDSPGLQLSLPGTAAVGGLVLLVLAEVFASGVRLRDDLDGTV